MSVDVRTTVDPEKCVGCGLCVKVCPHDTLALVEGKARVVGETSLQCGHCEAVCPEGAVTVAGLEGPGLSSVEEGSAAAELVDLMARRRSCRVYKNKPVARAVLGDLVRIAALAPSGTNSQLWRFTVLDNREAVVRLAEAVGGFYGRLVKLSGNPLARLWSKLFMGDALGFFHREYSERVQEVRRAWVEEGRDRLFHGAPAVICISTAPGASCGGEDACMASQNLVLAAEALGLGTCLIGFASIAMGRDPSIAPVIGIPADETVHAVVAVGHPAVTYLRLTGRRPIVIR
jgi:nitroreductase/NAD-dependent dihydropyrimidine dehydrogenase PreA subunit